MTDRPLFTTEDYISILDLTFHAIEAIKDKEAPDPRSPDCQLLATKLFYHAASILWLSNGTKAPVPWPTGGSFFDFASSRVIARAALETYFTLYEVFIQPSSDDDLEFKHAFWQLSGFVVRENITPTDPSLQQDAIRAQEEIAIARDRIRKTDHFAKLSPKKKDKVLLGKRVRNWEVIARSAGFGTQFRRRLYDLYSAYVHADGLSASQIFAADTPAKQKKLFDIDMLTLVVLLSKLIVEYANRFPESKAACEAHAHTYARAKMLSEVVNRTP